MFYLSRGVIMAGEHKGSDMSDTGTARDLNKQEIPLELKSLAALNAALKAARASEADKQFIAAALEVKALAFLL